MVLGLILVIMALSLTAMKPAAEKGSTLGLATALKEEFEATRQLAIKGGHPVALGIPARGELPANSIYRLSGWNTPHVNLSMSFGGDYPGLGFAACLWNGAPEVGASIAPPDSAKFLTFEAPQLQAWLTGDPDHDYSNDYIFCYLPDGSLITNNLPTSDGHYPVVIAGNPTFAGVAPSSVQISTGNNPWTLLISPHGAVDLINGTPGGTLAAGSGTGDTSAPQARTQSEEQAKIYLSELNVRPLPDPSKPNESICTPGEVVTLEIFAHCPQGDELFANWTQIPGDRTKLFGTFTNPNQVGSKLENEADRMEFIPANRIPTKAGLKPLWKAGENPPINTGIWRAQWSWTVPLQTLPGELFDVTVNVQNAQNDAKIMTSPLPRLKNDAPKPGSMIVERKVNGLWQLWRMNPNGSGEHLLSPEGVQEMMPSLDRFGKRMALIRQGPGGIGDRHIIIRSIDGGLETVITNTAGRYTSVSMSPLGDWVAYRDDDADKLLVTRTDKTNTITKSQEDTSGHGYAVNKLRSGWSQDGKYMLYEQGTAIHSLKLSNGKDIEFLGPYDTMDNGNVPWLYAPTSYVHGGKEYVILSHTTNKPFLLSLEVTDYDTKLDSNFDAATSNRRVRDLGPDEKDVTHGLSMSYADVSHDGKLTYTQGTSYTIGDTKPNEEDDDLKVYIMSNITSDGIFYGPPTVMQQENIRRAIFIPPSE